MRVTTNTRATEGLFKTDGEARKIGIFITCQRSVRHFSVSKNAKQEPAADWTVLPTIRSLQNFAQSGLQSPHTMPTSARKLAVACVDTRETDGPNDEHTKYSIEQILFDAVHYRKGGESAHGLEQSHAESHATAEQSCDYSTENDTGTATVQPSAQQPWIQEQY